MVLETKCPFDSSCIKQSTANLLTLCGVHNVVTISNHKNNYWHGARNKMHIGFFLYLSIYC